jgi:hypothetical protein
MARGIPRAIVVLQVRGCPTRMGLDGIANSS